MNAIVVHRTRLVSRSGSLALANNNGNHIDDPNNGGNDAISNSSLRCVCGELDTKSTIDDAESDQSTTEPDVSI